MPNNDKVSRNSLGAGFAEQRLRVDLFRKGFLLNDMFDEPTYLTFYIDFDFGGNLIDNTTNLISSPLLNTGNSRDDDMGLSASIFLKNRGLNLEHGYFSNFINKLEYITNNTPWYFQKITGLDKLWSSTVKSQKTGSHMDIELDIACLESVDLRILEMAEMYQKSVYDQKFMKALIPENLRKFQMSIYVGEVRDISSNPIQPTLGGALANAFREATARTSSVGGLLKSNFRINSVYYYKFDCFNCEFDFTPVFNSALTSFTEQKFNDTSFKIKVGRVESAGSFGESSFTSNLYKDRFSNEVNRDRTRKLLLDEIGAAQRNSLSRENITLLKLANSLGPFSEKAKSKLLDLDRKIQQVTRTPNRFVNSALSEIQRLTERGGLNGTLSRNNNSNRRNF